MQRAACCRRCARARRHHSMDRSGQRARTRSLTACKLSCAYTSSTPTLPVSAPRCRWVRTSLSITRAPHTSGAAPRMLQRTICTQSRDARGCSQLWRQGMRRMRNKRPAARAKRSTPWRRAAPRQPCRPTCRPPQSDAGSPRRAVGDNGAAAGSVAVVMPWWILPSTKSS